MMQVIAVREVLEHHYDLGSKFEFDFNYISNNCVLYQRRPREDDSSDSSEGSPRASLRSGKRLPPLEESSSGGADESSPEDSDFSTGSLPSPPKYCIVSDLLVFYNM
ncbi:hypothetical protein GBAR_LOCUS18065 [Geodia barretti]|uniref:Uncharacterized protein n=1 Tax=Geodia barretti TaxID=519541 RepID=A0AA35SL62_GEOBA|nr:hypothetical protein GBAR_LOCUS18065 [Geodia barretti]